MIEVDHITIFSPKDKSNPILKNINYTFEKGTVTLLVGQTGSGKTTFLHALAGLIPIETGSIKYGDLCLWKGNRIHDEVKFAMGIAFQYPERQLFAESIMKEFNYSLRPFRLTKQEMINRTYEALSEMNLSRDILKESVHTLSDGLKRKVALSTTFATKPQWLFLDEPTAGIDPDSILTLVDVIRSYKHNGCGFIIASHDLDTFLPLADHVLVLNKGKIDVSLPPTHICANPGVLLNANVGLPSNVQISKALQNYGLPMGECPLTPTEMAAAIIKQINNRTSNRKKESLDDGHMNFEEEDGEAVGKEKLAPVSAPESQSESNIFIQKLSPITLWLFYIVLSTAILLQDHWIGVVFAAVIIMLCICIAGASFRTVVRPTKPFIYFILISSILSGLQITLVPDSLKLEYASFSFSSFIRTAKQLSEFFLVMVLGILFAVTTSQRMLLRGMEQSFSFLNRFKVPVGLISFSASLIFRFIPMLFLELERLSLIIKARGKLHVKQGSIRLRDVHLFMIPLILFMMKNAEELAIALEARGFNMKTPRVASTTTQLKFHNHDFITMALGFIMLCIFVTIDFMF